MVNGFHPRVEAAIDAALLANGGEMWIGIWRATVAQRVLVPRALELFEPDTVRFSADWRSLDDPVDRRGRVRAVALRDPVCAAVIAQHERLNAALAAAGMREERVGRLKRFLPARIDRLLADPLTDAALDDVFPAAWSVLANAVARNAHERRVRLGAMLEEWRAMNERLVAAYLSSSTLDRAALVEAALVRMADGPIGVRGRLVRLVEQTSRDGIEDVIPPPAPPVGARPLAHANLSDLLTATVDAWHSTQAGQGLLHRFLNVNAVPRELPPGVTFAQLVAGRSAAYRQHEYTLVTYLALASIEQLLRGAAQRAGIDHGPAPVLEWLEKLRPSACLRDAVDAIYHRHRGNIRNRFMHAGLLDIESKRMEHVLVAAGHRPPNPAPDPYSPRNIAQLSFNALETVDNEVAQGGLLTAADFAWTPAIDLAADEVAFGAALPFDFARPDGVALQQRMSDFLTVVAPATSQLFRVGFVGWLRRTNRDTLPMFVAMLVVFEGVARMVEHLCGLPVLQWDDRGRCQYTMFDERGLASATARDRIVGELAGGDRDAANRTISLAMKVRNAFAHGAILFPAPGYLDAAGHLLVKSALAFMLAGEQHLIREAAFFEFENADRGELENWLAAERDVLAGITAAARARR